MNRSPMSTPRGLVTRSLIAATLFAGSVVPGWTLGALLDEWTGWPPLGWLSALGWSAGTLYALAPHTSFRRRDAVLGLVPLLGWYVTAVLAWRAALLPYRDWEPRTDELWRARWLTEELVGLWRTDPLAKPARRPSRTRPGAVLPHDAS